MEFKQLEIPQKKKSFRQIITSSRLRKTMLSILIGAIAGFGYFYLTEGKMMDEIVTGDVIRSLLIGGFFGFFITNSPCARGRC